MESDASLICEIEKEVGCDSGMITNEAITPKSERRKFII
jgi:hypothetical protein